MKPHLSGLGRNIIGGLAVLSALAALALCVSRAQRLAISIPAAPASGSVRTVPEDEEVLFGSSKSNAFGLTLEKALHDKVEYSAAFRADLMFGENPKLLAAPSELPRPDLLAAGLVRFRASLGLPEPQALEPSAPKRNVLAK